VKRAIRSVYNFDFSTVVTRNDAMGKSFGFKILGALGLSATLALAACGGGGGDPGTPLVPPTYHLTMTPNISSLRLRVGQFIQPVKISGGQKPYYIGQGDNDGSSIIPTILDDGTVTLLAVRATVASDSTSGSTSSSSDPCSGSSGGGGSGSGGGGSIWIQDSAYAQTTLSFTTCVSPAPALFSSLTNAGVATITLNPGQSLTFNVYGTAPYQEISGNPLVANFSGNIFGQSANGVITVTAGTTSGKTTIVVVDSTSIAAGGPQVFVLPVEVVSP
jgi:hypothetical protein